MQDLCGNGLASKPLRKSPTMLLGICQETTTCLRGSDQVINTQRRIEKLATCLKKLLTVALMKPVIDLSKTQKTGMSCDRRLFPPMILENFPTNGGRWSLTSPVAL